MTARTLRGAWIVATAAVAMVVLARSGISQPPAEVAAKPMVVADIHNASASIAECKACHSGPDERGVRDFKNKFKSHEFIRLDESVIWEENDPHGKAFAVLDPTANPIAKIMQKSLEFGNPEYRVQNDVRCLTCHATDMKPTQKTGKLATDFARNNDVGVGCLGCHGVGAEWQVAHYKSDPTGKNEIPWRSMTPKVKEEKGQRNLRDPLAKAEMCASCHVGNPDEGKVVTHEMYAAGHPPLPPFELASFIEGQPKHWNNPSKTPYLVALAKNKPTDAYDLFQYRTETIDNYTARHIAAGAMASMQAEMKLLHADASERTKNPSHMLDFARFDCYACHHDLKIPSDRQERGYEGAPGRPPLKAWVSALPAVIAANAGQGTAFDEKWGAVKKASLAKPFGDTAEVLKASSEMIAWYKPNGKEFMYSTEATTALRGEIEKAIADKKWRGDTEAIMHLTWAYRSLRSSTKDEAKLDPLGVFLPQNVRELSKEQMDKKVPVTAGEVLADRQKKFAAFDWTKFQEEFGKLTK